MHTAALHKAPLITFVSASGGVGKSTLALLSAHLTAAHGIETALIEGDLQFGDMGFWLGMDIDLPCLSQGTDCAPITIAEHLDYFKAPVLPEVADEISDAVAELVHARRSQYELVIADTGQFWSGLTGELLCSSDLIIIVMDQREASVYGAIKAMELCHRLGIPAARITFVSNRTQSRSRSETEHLCSALGTNEVFGLADGKAAVEVLVSRGRIEELIDTDGAPVPDVKHTLSSVLPRIGLAFEPSASRKRRRFFA